MVMCCLLYTSDAADEARSVNLGGRRILKKKTHVPPTCHSLDASHVSVIHILMFTKYVTRWRIRH
ncbi:hypothetical protein PVA38_12020 [Streptococcus pneumoniae D39]|nr:hypothetical protein PVA38_12020 [Streptococcus pneumoniae D39]